MITKNFLSKSCIIFAFLLLTGCGITGKTSPFKLNLNMPTIEKPMPTIKVISVELEEESTRLEPVGVYEWGKFCNKDLSVLEKSLKDTIIPINTNKVKSQDELNIYIVIRRYLTATSNTGGAILACIAWCITNHEGNIVYHEQFFASKVVYLVVTAGTHKDIINKAIVDRIAKTTIRIATSNGEADIVPVTPKNTYNSFEKAAQNLPKQMKSVYTMNYPLGRAYYFHYSTIGRQIDWDWAKHSDNINWDNYLTQKKRAVKLSDYETMLVHVSSQVTRSSKEIAQFENTIINRLREKGLFEKVISGSISQDRMTDLRLNIKIIELKKVSIGTRLFLGFWAGQPKVTADVKLTDMKTKKCIGTFKAEGEKFFMGTSGQAIEQAVDQIVEFVQKRM